MAADEKNHLNVNGIKQLKENHDTKRITIPNGNGQRKRSSTHSAQVTTHINISHGRILDFTDYTALEIENKNT